MGRFWSWFIVLAALAGTLPAAAEVSARGREAAELARERYAAAAEETLADLVAFKTVRREGMANVDNPEFVALKAYLRRKAAALGLDFEDRGAVLLIGLGSGPACLGLVTHGDVQPADPELWTADPFRLDVTSEPGSMVGRGAEDDKGPLATALYAMKAIEDLKIPLRGRIELIISLTEESDWGPFLRFLETYEPPELNVALDANYPVVTAEKGWGEIHLTLPPRAGAESSAPRLESFTGGSFLSQVPELAAAVVAGATPEVEAALRAAAGEDTEVSVAIHSDGGRLTLEARGRSAHSMNPWDGRNAITHLASILGRVDWPDGQAARMVRLILDLVGLGDYGEKFGDLAHAHPFMGPLTLTLAKLAYADGNLEAGISFRRPMGRTAEEVAASIQDAVEAWKQRTGTPELGLRFEVKDPYYLQDAPHIPILLEVFRHYTGMDDADPISIGGGTNVRLLPNGVSFGPAMPGAVYTGHTEHELITRDQFLLNLRMYTAMMVEVAGR